MKNNKSATSNGELWKKFKYGVFDIDGTIFDNMGVSADAFRDTIENFNLPQEDLRKIYLETNGMNLNDQYKLIFDKFGIGYSDALIQKLNKEFFALRDNWEKWQSAPVFPGIKNLLEKLKQNGIKNFVSSGSNTDEIIFRLKKANILENFELVLGAEIIPKGNRHFEKFADHCGVSAEEFSRNAFLLSDGANDMALARSAGIFAIGVTNTLNEAKLKSAGASIVVSSIDQLANSGF